MSSSRTSVRRRCVSLLAVTPLAIGAIVASSTPAAADVVDRPAIEVRSSVNGTASATTPGPTLSALGTKQYRAIVTNTGNVDLTDLWTGGFLDGKTVGRGFCPFVQELAVGESIECETNTSAPQSAFQHQFRARARAVANGKTVFDNDLVYFRVARGPAIELVQSSNGRPSQGSFVALPQGRVVWDYTVTNVGIEPLTDVEVVDPVFGVIPCPSTTLAVDATMQCQSRRIDLKETGTYPYVTTPVYPSTYVSSNADGELVDDRWFTAFRIVESGAAIKVDSFVNGLSVKQAAKTDFDIGRRVEFTYKVRNQGDAAVTDIAIDDAVNGTATCDGDSIAPGAFVTCVSDRGAVTLNTAGAFGTTTSAVATTGKVSVYSQQTLRFDVTDSAR